jgi:mannose-6-phosphate isomerase-like protein (cupin superfamily)
MLKINSNTAPARTWNSPKGTYAGSMLELSVQLGRKPESLDLRERHPFDVAICRIPAGKKPWPYHSHSAQWEFYHVISGTGVVRDPSGTTPVAPGDAFLYPPGEPHQLINTGNEDLVVYIIADNPIGESCHYPDSAKWLVRAPERRLMRGPALEYFDGEE